MDIISKTVLASTNYEVADGRLKKLYLLKHIAKFNEIVSALPGYSGFFGLGYPFYALGQNFEGDLPIIAEQFRYNTELLAKFHEAFDDGIWPCEHCLKENLYDMPDLKKICYRCPEVPKDVSPRKVINRLPDMDFCLVIKDGNEEEVKERLIKSFNENGFHTSDIDPIGTIEKMYRISNRLKTGYVPTEFVPIDTHLFTYSELSKLMGKLEPEIERALSADRAPYVPTFPDSLRKTWQKDDTAINFFYDYMYSFTEYDFDSELSQQLKETRKSIVTKYTNEQLEKMVLEAGPESQRRRYQCPTLKLRFNERMDSWRKE